MGLAFRYDTLSLMDEPNGLAVERHVMPDRTRVPHESAPRRHGVVRTEEPTLEHRIITFAGSVVKASESALRTWIDDSLKVLNGTQKNFYLYDDLARYVVGTKTDFRWRLRPASAARVLDYDCEVFASDPFWYRSTTTSDTQTHTTHPTTSLTFSHTNPGSAFVYPKYTITANISGAISSITFNNTTIGKSWTFTATIASGKALIFDTALFTVTNDGANAVKDMTGVPVWLNSGSNSITFSGGNATILIEYRGRHFGP